MRSKLPLNTCIASANTGLDAIKRAPIVEENTGIRCIRIQDISQVKNFENWGFTDVTPANFKKFQLKKDDILIARTGGSIGVNRYIDEDLQSVYNNGLIRIRVDTEKYDPKFVFYLLQTESFKQHINAIAFSTAAQPNMKIRDFLRFEFLDITLEEQKLIAQYLTSLDRKIELNKKINQTLENMAQAIFKSWFVDFDPVIAKMNYEQPEGMDAATASLFPEKLDSKTGIPDGWTQGIIADIAKLNAKSWTMKNQPEQVQYVDLANTKNGVIETVTTYDFDEAPSRARRVLNSGDTIIGTVRPGNRSFAFIGETEQPLTGSTGFAVLSPKEEFWTSFVYLATTNDYSIDEYARLADGGAYPAIKPTVVADTSCAIPTEDIAQKFWQITGAMLKKTHQNRLENQDLTLLRNTLLPKLLSGELSISD